MPDHRRETNPGFGNRLRDLMERERVSPGQLAREQGVVPGTVSRWRAGKVPGDLRLEGLARRLRTTVNYLKTGAEPSISGEGPSPGPGRPEGATGHVERQAVRRQRAIVEEAERELRERGFPSVSATQLLGILRRMLLVADDPTPLDEGEPPPGR